MEKFSATGRTVLKPELAWLYCASWHHNHKRNHFETCPNKPKFNVQFPKSLATHLMLLPLPQLLLSQPRPKKCNSVSHLKKGELTSMQIRKEAVDAMVVTASNYDNVCVLAMSAHEKTSTGKGKNVVLMEIVRALNCNDQFLLLHDALPANSTGTNKLHRWLREDLEWFRNTNLHNGNQPFAKKSSVPEIADLAERLTLTWNDTIAAIDQKQVWNSAIGLVWLLTFLFLQQAGGGSNREKADEEETAMSNKHTAHALAMAERTNVVAIDGRRF